jgi:predicted HD superfamily hydrolase involved in NAD metabolism
MKQLDKYEIEEEIKRSMTHERFQHSLRVRDTALRLAEIYGCKREGAEFASLLHDVARDIPVETMRKLFKENDDCEVNIDIDSDNYLLLHAKAGKIIAKQKFGVKDEDVLRSIELHTTGGVSMTLLNKVVFVADFIEPERKFKGVEKARELSFLSLEETVLYIYKFLLKRLLRKELFICQNTFLGYNEIIQNKRKNGK